MFCEDFTEGKFSFPIAHAINQDEAEAQQVFGTINEKDTQKHIWSTIYIDVSFQILSSKRPLITNWKEYAWRPWKNWAVWLIPEIPSHHSIENFVIWFVHFFYLLNDDQIESFLSYSHFIFVDNRTGPKCDDDEYALRTAQMSSYVVKSTLYSLL